MIVLSIIRSSSQIILFSTKIEFRGLFYLEYTSTINFFIAGLKRPLESPHINYLINFVATSGFIISNSVMSHEALRSKISFALRPSFY